MSLHVYYEDWQLEDSGHPFSVGDYVEWPTAEFEPEQFGAIDGSFVDRKVEHEARSNEKITKSTGTVSAIRALSQRYEEYRPGYLAPVYGDVTLSDCTRTNLASDWALDRHDESAYRFMGYIATLDA